MQYYKYMQSEWYNFDLTQKINLPYAGIIYQDLMIFE